MILSRSLRRLRPALLSLILVFSTLTQSCGKPEQADFSAFSKQLFEKEVSGNTLTLHYTLADPSAYGIHSYDLSLGSPSTELSSERNELTALSAKLHTYESSPLSEKDQLTLETLEEYIDHRMKLNEYADFDDPLLPSGGDAGQLPLLLAQYTFRDSRDITDYLTLLGQVDTYMARLLELETKRAKKGLFMSQRQLQDVISLLKNFVTPIDQHFLTKSFHQRLGKLRLDPKITKIYEKNNKRLIKESIFPSYKRLLKGIRSLKKYCRKSIGLCRLKNGKNYYRVLVSAYTGCEDSLERLDRRISDSRSRAIANASLLTLNHAELLTGHTLSDSRAMKKLERMSDIDMVKSLTKAMKKDFPDPPDLSCRISAVTPSLRDYLAPAFYITAPLDRYRENTIYINSASDYSPIRYFTTLAHEGLPGHLYQTVMSYHEGLSPIRGLLDFPGYTEGWATYVELLSYSYSGLPGPIAKILKYDQMATLSLYATCDLGIHYFGWNAQKLRRFWAKYGVRDKKTVDEIADLILSDPGNYLKYYVGFLNVLQLKNDIKSSLGSRFSLKKFHGAVVKMGPTSFRLLKKHFMAYY